MMERFAELLKVKNTGDTNAMTVTVKARLIGIGLGDICTRCGGTGNYSYNQVHGTKCYGCNGAGRHAPELNENTFADAQAAVAAGALDAYFETKRRNARLGKSIQITYDALTGLTGDTYHILKNMADKVNYIATCAQIAKDPERKVTLENLFQTQMDAFLAKVAEAKNH